MEETQSNKSWWILAIILLIAFGIGLYLYMRPVEEKKEEKVSDPQTQPESQPQPQTNVGSGNFTINTNNQTNSEPIKLPSASIENLSLPIGKIKSTKTDAGLILQAILKEAGENITIDGKVGPKTKAAVKSFVEKSGKTYSDSLTVYYIFKLLDSSKYPTLEYVLTRQAKNFPR